MNTNQQARFDDLYQQHLRALKRHGKATKTIEAYGRAVRRLSGFVDDCPDELTTDTLNAFFEWLIDSHGWSTVKLDRNGIRFFYEEVLGKSMPWLDMVRPPKIQALPDVLTLDEIARLICATRERRFRVFWLATYSMGLRLGETLKLEISDIDSARMRVHVRLGKGMKDRFVVLPAITLEALRRWWAAHRHTRWLFPSQTGTQDAPALQVMDRGTTQRAFKRAAEDASIRKHVSIHSLRHSYATHLVKAGLNLRAVQDQLGHASPTTTARYVRMTEASMQHQNTAINALLPAPYFMVTFTVPAALRPLAYRHPQAIYDLLFRTAIGTLRTFGLRHRDLEADLAATAVLHTHTRRLDYHPHLHVIVPGAGVDRLRRWRKVKGRYLFNGRALAKVFRARFLDGLRRAGFELPARYPSRWIVQCQHVGQGLPALKYLSRYLYRGVIAEAQIVAFDRGTQAVTFRFQEGKTREPRLRTLPLVEFLWRLMIHVLPSGYRRVRDFGFLHGNARRTRALIQVVLRVVIPAPPPREQACFRCPTCQGVMTVIAVLNTRPNPAT